jgi:hypothetical protein
MENFMVVKNVYRPLLSRNKLLVEFERRRK